MDLSTELMALRSRALTARDLAGKLRHLPKVSRELESLAERIEADVKAIEQRLGVETEG